ncbi:hypothetical protein T4B_9819 [Trichinella pseudospiralis]|nr:hypothetical protein T4B_9819 [Trichinella pseudospiralis]KRY93963.1 hypothetical protein T4C_12506 [Trichinella pseudospiralis]
MLVVQLPPYTVDGSRLKAVQQPCIVEGSKTE